MTGPVTGPDEREHERRRRREEVFGDTEPQTTSDERDPEDGSRRRDGDTWLREQVPPHHGG
jgi:hypothetical protein